MADIFSFEVAKARQRVRRAERSLEKANELLDEHCGVGLGVALCNRIRTEQTRVIDARARFGKVASAPTAHY